MKHARNRRAIFGTSCLIVLALALGWFVGQYIPGTPHEPQGDPLENLFVGSGIAITSVADCAFGQTASLPEVTQGDAFTWDANHPTTSDGNAIRSSGEQEIIESLKQMGRWERTYPRMDLRVDETRVVSGQSIAEWYPDYYRLNKILTDSEAILVTLSVTNASDAVLSDIFYRGLPEIKLWSEDFIYLDDTLGSGLMRDDATLYVNETGPAGAGSSSDNALHGQEIAPGETATFVLAFRVRKGALEDASMFEDFDPSRFCLQIPDYATGTAYRLWLS